MTTQTIKYCHCRFEFSDARVERGKGRWVTYEVWVCNKCDGMHHVRQVWPMPRTVKRAPKGSIGFLSLQGGGDSGLNQLVYSMGGTEKAVILSIHTHNRRPPTMPIQPTDLLLHTWERLDYYTAKILAPDPLDDAEQNKAAARAIAEVLTPMMSPFFSTTDGIVREAVNRYKNRDNPDYETPGLGVESLAEHDKMPMARPITTPAAKPEKELSETDKAGIRTALSSGMFPIKTLATTYGVSEATIKSLQP